MSELLIPLVRLLETHQRNPGRFIQVIDGTFGHSTHAMHQIHKAHRDASEAHYGQLRDDGQRYITHPEGAALIVVEYLGRSDVTEGCATLLHDAPEDHPETWPISKLRVEYSIDVADSVNGCNRRRFDYIADKATANREFLHQLLTQGNRATAVVKLAERMHNGLTVTPNRLANTDWVQRKLADIHAYYIPLARKHQLLYREMIALAETLERQEQLLTPPPVHG
jgi:GTP pyrophosphokinase